MKRIAACVVLVWLALIAPACATALLNVPVTTAVTTQLSSTFQLRGSASLPTNITLQGTFTYGSGGTTADAYVQTSVDGGTTWADVAEFHFATASARFIFNLNSSTSNTTELTPKDGTLGSNTSVDGLIGSQFRVKYTTTGTYAGGTTLRIDAFANGLTLFTPGD